MIERVSISQGGRLTSVDPASSTLVTDFGNYTAAVANIIPPQKAGRLAEIAGAADKTGWCPIDPVTFASKLVPNIHVIGDACLAGAHAAIGVRGEFARQSLRRRDRQVDRRQKAAGYAAAVGACYNTVAPGYAFSQSGVYQAGDGMFVEAEGRRHQPGRCAARDARAGSRRGAILVQDHHGGGLWLG